MTARETRSQPRASPSTIKGMTDQQREMLRRRVLGVPAPETHEQKNERASDEDDASDVRLVASAA